MLWGKGLPGSWSSNSNPFSPWFLRSQQKIFTHVTQSNQPWVYWREGKGTFSRESGSSQREGQGTPPAIQFYWRSQGSFQRTPPRSTSFDFWLTAQEMHRPPQERRVWYSQNLQLRKLSPPILAWVHWFVTFWTALRKHSLWGSWRVVVRVIVGLDLVYVIKKDPGYLEGCDLTLKQ